MVETIRLKSKALGENVIVNVIYPNEGAVKKLMILLHGSMFPEASEDLFHEIPKELDLEELCDKYHIMIAIPLMKNRYYISTKDYDCEEYVAYELPSHMKQRYCLPDSVDMILAGISMGGYGAALIAARTNAFRKIISVSGSFIAKDVEIGNPEVWGELTPDSDRVKDTFLYYFLPLENLGKALDRNVVTAIRLMKDRGARPEFLVSCGTGDWLYKRNLDFLKVLEELGIEYSFKRISGGNHDSICFKTGLWNAVEYTCSAG